MRTVELGRAGVRVGDRLTVWVRRPLGCGQGGVVEAVGDDGVSVRSPIDNLHVFPWADVERLTAEVPYAREECRDWGRAGENCAGDVDDWWTGGINGRHVPRCSRHGERRLREHEHDRAQRLYAPDSDVPPPGFREDDAGERWGDEY